MNETICKMININKIFPGTQALNNVDFDIRAAEVHSLIGTNGSGKTTLANILAGTFAATSGDIIFNNDKVVFNNPSQAMRKGIVLIHQELKLIPEMTVAENIYFGRFIRNKWLPAINWKKMNKASSKILKELGTDISPNQKISKLSIADQQLVEIAKVLSKEAKIMIMDEPTASLTIDEVEMLFKIIKGIKERGISIVYISHRLEEVLQISNRITILEDSKLVTTIRNEPGVTKQQLVKLMIPKSKETVAKKVKKGKIDKPVIFSAKNVNYSNKVKDFSFDLKESEVLGLAGLVGAGRTELMKCIFGAFKVKSGEFYIRGKPYKPKSPISALRNRIALISEDRKGEGLILTMSIVDNMLFPNFKKYILGPVIKQRKMRADIEEQANKLNIRAKNINVKVSNLSGGNQQKVVIGKWLLANSDIILMDEPTRGIDVGAKAEVYDLVYALSKAGKSIVFISSELEEVLQISDRILVMYNGRNVREFNKNTTMEELVQYATGTDETIK